MEKGRMNMYPKDRWSNLNRQVQNKIPPKCRKKIIFALRAVFNHLLRFVQENVYIDPSIQNTVSNQYQDA